MKKTKVSTSRRVDIQNIFGCYTSGGSSMSASALLRFLYMEQMEKAANQTTAEGLIEKYEIDETARASRTMTFAGFYRYMESKDGHVFDQTHMSVYQDMTQPLCHYYISSSHNTYLTGNQLVGRSRQDSYASALMRGCRCLEIDCWDGPAGEPIVYHGHTLTSKIFFKDIILTIEQHAFEVSPFPVILSLENHCSCAQQDVMAQHLTSILGDKLLVCSLDDTNRPGQLPSPEALKYKILIKNKKLNPQNEHKAAARSERDQEESREGGSEDRRRRDQEESRERGSEDRRRRDQEESRERGSEDRRGRDHEESREGGSEDRRGRDQEEGRERGSEDRRRRDQEEGRERGSEDRRGRDQEEGRERGSEDRREGESRDRRDEEAEGEDSWNEDDDDEDEEVEEEEEPAPKKTKHPTKLNMSGKKKAAVVADALSNLVVYTKSVKFRSFAHSREHQRYFENTSLGEKKARKLAKTSAVEFLQHNMAFITRIYPAGSRTLSSNYNPQEFWNVGSQLVALNVQSLGRPMDLNNGRFQDNGRCGYVLKPNFLRMDVCGFNPNSCRHNLRPCHLLLKVVSGSNLPASRSGKALDPFIRLEVVGVHSDCTSQDTDTVKRNSLNPHWDTAMNFLISVPDLCLIRFSARYQTGLTSEFIGQYTLPFISMKKGYRWVPLLSREGYSLDPATLFIFVWYS